MFVDDVLVFHVGCLIFPGRVLAAELHHSVAAVVAALVAVGAEEQSFAAGLRTALDIDLLSESVVVVKAGLAQLELDGSRFVLDVDALVEIARPVGSDDPSGDHDVILDLERIAVRVHCREVGDCCVDDYVALFDNL